MIQSIFLWTFTLLFMTRVLGQMIQRWLPQPYLPPFESFQGSGLPYWLLLSAQAVILVAMAWYAWQVYAGRLVPRGRAGAVLFWLGSAYMAGSLIRILVGMSIPSAPAWFSAWVPAIFHVVLAGYVLTLASCHRQQPTQGTTS